MTSRHLFTHGYLIHCTSPTKVSLVRSELLKLGLFLKDHKTAEILMIGTMTEN